MAALDISGSGTLGGAAATGGIASRPPCCVPCVRADEGPAAGGGVERLRFLPVELFTLRAGGGDEGGRAMVSDSPLELAESSDAEEKFIGDVGGSTGWELLG